MKQVKKYDKQSNKNPTIYDRSIACE